MMKAFILIVLVGLTVPLAVSAQAPCNPAVQVCR